MRKVTTRNKIKKPLFIGISALMILAVISIAIPPASGEITDPGGAEGGAPVLENFSPQHVENAKKDTYTIRVEDDNMIQGVTADNTKENAIIIHVPKAAGYALWDTDGATLAVTIENENTDPTSSENTGWGRTFVRDGDGGITQIRIHLTAGENQRIENVVVTFDSTSTSSDGTYEWKVDMVDIEDNSRTGKANVTVDGTKPTVISIEPSVEPLTDENIGSDNFWIKVTYSENMDNTVYPDVVFTPDVSHTLENQDNTWIPAENAWLITYDVKDDNAENADINVTVENAKDLAGNLQVENTTENVFNIDTKEPTVVSITPNTTLIKDNYVGSDKFTLTIEYDENMNNALPPDVAFSPDVSATLENAENDLSPENTWTITYDVADNEVDNLGVDVIVENAEDIAHNVQVDNTTENVFDIDTKDPTVLIQISHTLITDENAGENFQVTATFSENMDNAVYPSITFTPDVTADNTLYYIENWWSADNTVYCENFRINDENVENLDVDVKVADGKDLVGNLQAENTGENMFDVDTKNPTVVEVLVIPSLVSDFNIGENLTITVEFSENMDNTVYPTITFTPNVTLDTLQYAENWWSSDNKTYYENYLIRDENVENIGVDVSVENAKDLVGNDQVSYLGENVFDIDTISPIIVEAITGDSDFDGRVDNIKVKISKDLVDNLSIIDTTTFSLSVGTIGNVTTGEVENDDVVWILGITGINDTSTTPDVTLKAGKLSDGVHMLSVDRTFTETEDGAAPVLLYAWIDAERSDANDSDNKATMVKATFSESVDTSGSLGLWIGGTIADNIDEQDDNNVDNYYVVAQRSVLQTGNMPEVTSVENVIDSANNSAVLYENENVAINTFRRTLTSGWNYASFPIADRHEYNIGDYFSDTTKVEVVWTYADGAWACYDPDIDPADKIKVRGGFGYLVVIKSDQTLLIAPNVYNVATGEYPIGLPVERSVDAGWNLIGHYQEFDQIKAEAFDTISTGVDFHTNVVYVMTQTGLVATDTLIPGQAYWAFADADGTYAEGSGTGT